jgi:uncharacterized Zn-binding protein involved in type VI secretion
LTVLIATRQGVWADRRETGGASVYRPARKVVAVEGLAAAFCGDAAACVRAQRAVRSGEADPDALAALCDGLLVTGDGEVWELWCKLAQRLPRRLAWTCHGSGHVEAQAFLSGAGACDEATIQRALKYVARVRTDCGDGWDYAVP